jgi:uncharacterized membrane protein
MEESRLTALERRVEELERAVAGLSRSAAGAEPVARRLAEGPQARASAGSRPATAPEAAPASDRPAGVGLPSRDGSLAGTALAWFTGEGVIARIGIGLVLLSMVFLVRYGIDKGWLTEVVRVWLAVAAGAGLLVWGLLPSLKGRPTRHALLGGALGAFYVAVFAAHVLYGFVAPAAAVVLASAVTIGGVLLALREDSPVLAAVAILGGLGTPFGIQQDVETVVGLAGYLAAVQVFGGAVFLLRGWRTVQVANAIGTLPSDIFAVIALVELEELAGSGDQWALQGLLTVSLIVFVALPVVRALGDRWSTQPPMPKQWDVPFLQFVPIIASLAPVALYAMSVAVWDPSASVRLAAGGVAAAIAAWLYFDLSDRVATLEGASARERNLLAGSRALLFASVTLVVAGLAAGDRGEHIPGALAAMGALLLLVDARRRDEVAQMTGHVIAVIGALAMYQMFSWHIDQGTWSAVATLSGLAGTVGLFGASLITEFRARVVYGAMSLVAVLLFLLRELGHLDAGAGLSTASWAIVAVALLVIGARWDLSGVRVAGTVTTLAVVGKLLLYDLSELDAIWRILLFLIVGLVLLVVSMRFLADGKGEQPDGGGPGD